jgi:hypothetical protein
MNRLLALLSFILIVGLFAEPVRSQNSIADEDELKRFEVGGHFTLLRRSDADTGFETFRRFGFVNPSVEPEIVNEAGFGARFTYNFSRNIAIEAEANLFPEDKRTIPVIGVPIRVLEPGGRKLQAIAGPKIGYRSKKFGVFGKFRAGLIRLDRYKAVIGVGTPDNFYVLSERREKVGFLNFDVGGVFEYYPTKRTVFRIDVGDSIIHYRKLPPKEINPSLTRHNLQTSIGFGFRF